MLVSSQAPKQSLFDLKSYRYFVDTNLSTFPDLSTEEKEDRRTPPTDEDESPRLIIAGPSSNITFIILKGIFGVQYK